MMWNLDTLTRSDWGEVISHWHKGFGYDRDNDTDWAPIQKLGSEFSEDVRFAIWAFRNDWAHDKRKTKDRGSEKIISGRYLKKCTAAISALEDFAHLDQGGRIADELAPTLSALREFAARMRGDHKCERNSPKSKGGRPLATPINRLAKTVAYLWILHRGDCVGVDYDNFRCAVLIASQYRNNGKEIEEDGKLFKRAAVSKNIPVVPPLADLEFIHDAGASLYLRAGEAAIKTYIIGDKVFFPHRDVICVGDLSPAQLFAVGN